MVKSKDKIKFLKEVELMLDKFRALMERGETIPSEKIKQIFNLGIKGQQEILDNLETVFSLASDRISILEHLILEWFNKASEEEKKSFKNKVESFFVKRKNEDIPLINYDRAIYCVEDMGIISTDELLKIIVNNIQNIICDSCDLRLVNSQISMYIGASKLTETELDEIISKIDIGLADNYDKIENKEDLKSILPYIRGMRKLKTKIRESGRETLMGRISDYMKLEECLDLYEQIFEKCNIEDGLDMRFKKMEKSLITPIAIIIQELLRKSHGNCTIHDIEELGRGNYSTAIRAGDYVLKIGQERYTRIIQNDKRILQPIIRQPINPNREKGVLNYIEVQNVVDKKWWIGLSNLKVDEIIYRVYADLRDRGIIWKDPKVGNIGRLLKPNRINYTFTNIDGTEKELNPTEEAIDMKGTVNPEEVLQAGEYVVLDTDHLFLAEQEENIQCSVKSKYERRYQEEHKNKDGSKNRGESR